VAQVISGLLGGVGKLAGAVGSVAGSVVNGFKGLLGIHSPSLVFAEQIGRPIVEGIAMGITKSDAAHRALAGLKLAGPNVGGAGRLSGSQGGGMGSSGGMTNYITVNNPTPEPASTSVSRELRKVSYLAQAQ